MYLWIRFLLLLNICLEFFKLPLAHLQSLFSWLTDQGGGECLLSSSWKLQGAALFVRKNAQITDKFIIKNAVLGVPRCKKHKFFLIRIFVYLIVVAEMFLEVALFLET